MIVYDGSLGTYYRALYPEDPSFIEDVSLIYPERILRIHRDYLEAGAQRIKTNTFSAFPSAPGQSEASIQKQVQAAWQIASEAISSYNASIVADIGPHPLSGSVELEAVILQEYQSLAQALLDQGADEFLFETFDNLSDILGALDLIHKQKPAAKITVSFTINQTGYTKSGHKVRDLLRQAEEHPAIRISGFNCDLGPTHLVRLYLQYASFPKLQFLSPNSGQPERDLGRGRNASDAIYFASCFEPAIRSGLREIGGCCGTNPQDIRELAALATKSTPGPKPQVATSIQSEIPKPSANGESWYQRLLAGEKVIAVEFDTPQEATEAKIARYYRGVDELKAAGADLLTIADSPVGRVRLDSALMAAKIQDHFALPALPHLTCRDRNLNASRALLLALAANQISQVLVVTGDPLPLDLRQEIKIVFNTDSVRLLAAIADLNHELPKPFILCCALNVNARNFAPELRRAEDKVQAGANVFFTQPVFTRKAAENLALAKATLPQARFMAGIMPVVSHKNALFLRHEMSGMDIPDSLVTRYEGLGREDAEAVACEVSLELMKTLEPITDGYYLMTPFSRTSLIARILHTWHQG